MAFSKHTHKKNRSFFLQANLWETSTILFLHLKQLNGKRIEYLCFAYGERKKSAAKTISKMDWMVLCVCESLRRLDSYSYYERKRAICFAWCDVFYFRKMCTHSLHVQYPHHIWPECFHRTFQWSGQRLKSTQKTSKFSMISLQF